MSDKHKQQNVKDVVAQDTKTATLPEIEPVAAPAPEEAAPVAPKEHSKESLLTAFNKSGIALYKQRSGYPLSQAQRNLDGRTHYVDDANLKTAHAEVLICEVLDDGMLLGIVESFKENADAARKFRPVFFDLFGTVVAKPDADKCPDNARKANALFWTMTEELDPVKLNVEGINRRKEVLQGEVAKLDELAKAIQ